MQSRQTLSAWMSGYRVPKIGRRRVLPDAESTSTKRLGRYRRRRRSLFVSCAKSVRNRSVHTGNSYCKNRQYFLYSEIAARNIYQLFFNNFLKSAAAKKVSRNCLFGIRNMLTFAEKIRDDELLPYRYADTRDIAPQRCGHVSILRLRYGLRYLRFDMIHGRPSGRPFL